MPVRRQTDGLWRDPPRGRSPLDRTSALPASAIDYVRSVGNLTQVKSSSFAQIRIGFILVAIGRVDLAELGEEAQAIFRLDS